MTIRKGLLSAFGFLSICLIGISLSAIFVILELNDRFDISTKQVKPTLVTSKELHKEIVALNGFIIRYDQAHVQAELDKIQNSYISVQTNIQTKFSDLEKLTQSETHLGPILQNFQKINAKIIEYHALRQAETRIQSNLDRAFGEIIQALTDLDNLSGFLVNHAHNIVIQAMGDMYDLVEAGQKDPLYDTLDKILDVHLDDTNIMSNLKSNLLMTRHLLNRIQFTQAETDFIKLQALIETSLQALSQNIKKIKDQARREKAQTAFSIIQAHIKIIDQNILTYRQSIVSNQTLRTQIQFSLEGELQQLDQAMSDMTGHYDQLLAKLTDETEQAVKIATWVMGISATLLCLFALLITYHYIHKNIITRLCRLAHTTKSLSQGQTDIALPTANQDELGAMAKALTIFRDNLIEQKSLQAQHAQSEQRLAEEKRQVNLSLANQLEERISTIAASLSHASSAMKSASDHMVTASHTSEEQTNIVAQSANRTAQTANAVATASAEFSTSLHNLDQQVQNAAETAENISQRVQHTGATIASLEEAAQKIEQIIHIIGDIAGQTNLLALNATIEAARAGEAGKGFSIVASEVKSLATQTVQATENISLNVRDIQAITQEAVTDMNALVTEMKDVNQMTTEIAGAINQQNSTNVEIDQNIRHTAEGIHDISESIQSVTDATSQSKLASNDLSGIATDIDQQSTNLHRALKSFLDQMRAA